MNAPEALRQHFGQFGVVRKVLLSNASERSAECPFVERLRPSRFGFVLMERAEAAAAVLADSAEQIVSGWPVLVRGFEPRFSANKETVKSDGEEWAPAGGSQPLKEDAE